MTKHDELIAALENGQQCDEDGVMCIVSRQACHTAADAIRELQRINDMWAANSRETWQAMQAMRDIINEHIHMPSAESDLLQGPESSVFCEIVARCVADAIRELRAEAEAMRSGAICAAVKPLAWHKCSTYEGDVLDAVGVNIVYRIIPQDCGGHWLTYPSHKVPSASDAMAIALNHHTSAIDRFLTIRSEAEVRNEGFALGWKDAIEAVLNLPKRVEPAGGQMHTYANRGEICMITPPTDAQAALDDLEARVRAEVISEVLALPKRFERLGGQTYAYIKAEEIDALHTAKSRAIAEADEP